MQSSSIGWLLVVTGLAISAFGLIWVFAPSIPWLGHLPGEIRIERENFRFYFPLATCLLMSLLLTLVVWVVRWMRA